MGCALTLFVNKGQFNFIRSISGPNAGSVTSGERPAPNTMSERIKQLAEHVREHAPKLILEAQASILEAIEIGTEDANENQKDLVVKIPISVSWNLDKNKITVSVAVAVRHKFTSEGSLDDPNQLPLIDDGGAE